jgi:hypothetical protein
MMGLLFELAGSTLIGTLLIFLFGNWRARHSASFSGPSGKALAGCGGGWMLLSAISAWGASPSASGMLMQPILLLPSFVIAFLLVRRNMQNIQRDEESLESFE